MSRAKNERIVADRIVVEPSKNFILYRKTPLGIALFEALKELVDGNILTKEQALSVVTQFDYSIRKVIYEGGKNQCGFSFEGVLTSYRHAVEKHWFHGVFQNVTVYQHFQPAVIQEQLDLLQPSKKRRSGRFFATKSSSLRNQIASKDVRVPIERLSTVQLIARSDLIIHEKGTCHHPTLGICKAEPLNLPHPRLALFRLTQTDIIEEHLDSQDDPDAIAFPMPNRFKNSTMFDTSSDNEVRRPTMKYYSRQVTQDPNHIQRQKYVYSFRK